MAARTAFTTVLAGFGEDAPLPVTARLFAQAGVPVFPCAPGGKNPLTEHGFHDATTSLGQVESWWRRFPAANIGMPTGSASGVVVVDVDVHGVNGYDAFRQARRAGLVDGWEALVRSPTGGLHIYYPAAGGQQPSWQAGKAGIDFRGDRGYIIVPPSRRIIDGETAWYRLASLSPTPGRALDASALRTFLDPPRPPRRLPGAGFLVGADGSGEAREGGWAVSVRIATTSCSGRPACSPRKACPTGRRSMRCSPSPSLTSGSARSPAPSPAATSASTVTHPAPENPTRHGPPPINDLDAGPVGRVPSRGLR